ncbi:MAG TPA: hypothetical protein VJ898_06805 [Natrialbaceae archaeon]|nr:hypothetical protein [Natrialbaceae archaeon]
MVKRRKFLIGLGAVAAGSAAAVGTGAFSSAAMPDRHVTVAIDDDANGQIALVPGDDPDVTIGSDGQLSLDLTGANGEGVNINSVYTWGDPSDPASDYAFKIVNNDDAGESYAMKMNYYFANTGWVQGNGNGQSFIRFEVHDVGDGPTGSSAENYPHQSYNRDYSLGGPTGDNTPVGNYRFNPGEEYYVTVTVDTTGPNASVDDDLSGTANFYFSDDGVSEDSWYPDNPPN